ncbi:MAG: alpha/beta hydrolase [Solirubrobacterales bacterium]|nr:alpha/beta hydrolase [Solirubrobacterales bacterium]
MRTVHAQPPDAAGSDDGLAWALFVPDAPVSAGVVVLHGAGSRKESHFDFARAARASGLAALVFDARGHGSSDGPMDGRMLKDVATMAGVLRREAGVGAVGLRGSSMGGWTALAAAAGAGAGAVVAVCPASGEGLLRGLRAGRFEFDADPEALAPVFERADLAGAAATLGPRLLLLHAEGDETVPVEHSRELHAAAPASKLVAIPGGHHRSIQHDPELQGVSIRFLARALAAT